MVSIYWLENHARFAKRVDEIYSRMKERQDQLLTGAFTFGEVLTGVYRKGNAHQADEARLQLQEVFEPV
ncbi:MAG TPA: hypothetical protein VFQ18_02065 [Candidatus Acidoferrum sp.]|nr:hypothetical protein [Candidatus Acidoferrum sp.]